MPKPEDRKLTPKENYVRCISGEIPEWAPVYSVGIPCVTGEPMSMVPLQPSIISEHQAPGVEAKDIWGVTWVGNPETGFAKMPKTSDFLLKDICDWHDVIKAPSLEGVDWEQMVKDDIKKFNVDRDISAVGQNVYVGPFQTLVAFMGFTEAFIAMAEEPEEVDALMEYITDFYLEVQQNYFKYLQPEVLCLTDDTCSQNAPFMSEEMFRRFFVPCYKRHTDPVRDSGMPIEFHNCGTAAHYIEICHEEAGVTAWDPAQSMNDLVGFKAKNGNSICIVGGWDPSGQLLEPDCPDDVLIESVKVLFDALAPGGGYAFCGGFVGPVDDQNNARKQKVIETFALEYGGSFYD